MRAEQLDVETPDPALRRGPDDKLNFRSSLAFFAVHLVPFLAIFTGVTRTAVILAVVTFTTRMFCITAGYHRYFSHKSYRLNRVSQFLLAFGGTMASQKGPLWWAAHHRNHHRFSDTERDVHSPKRGFWWSHVGWILCDKYNQADMSQIRDFAKYPEIRFINKHDWIGPWTLAVVCFLIGGWSGLVIGFFLSTVVLWHVTFTVNSVAHVMGRRGVRNRRHEPQHAAGCARHGRRGLAQQPSPLPVGGAPGLPLVADRHDLLRAPCAQLGRDRARSPARARDRHRRSARRQGPRSSFGYFSPVSLTSVSVHTG